MKLVMTYTLPPILPLAEKNKQSLGVAIVAPSGYATDETALPRAIARLQQWRCQVHNYYDATAIYQRFGGTDTARIAQLYAAAENPQVDVIVALRGGYGLSRLLPALDFDRLAASGKIFVGHSDFTALHLGLLALTQTSSVAGPMICNDFSREDISDFTMRHFWDCLLNRTHTIAVQTQGNPTIDVSGILWGGNLAMLTHLIGTRYLPQIDGGILFIEDINEHPYRVERMILQLLHSGVLARQQALLLGDFSGYRLGEHDNGYDFAAMVNYLRERLPLPVLTGLPFGHIRDKVTLRVGADARLTADCGELQLMMNNPLLNNSLYLSA